MSGVQWPYRRATTYRAVLLPVVWLLFAGMLAACTADSEESPANENIVAEVPVRVAAYEPIVVSRTYTGRTAGIRDVEVRARVSGIIEGRGYREGELVPEGQSLFQIDRTRYEVRVQRAEAEFEQAEANVQQAERVWDRVSELFAENAASGRERDEARSALELARAGLALAEADLADAELDLEYTVVRAPVEGIAGLEAHAQGTLVEEGTLLTTLVQLAPIHVAFAIPESHMAMFGSQIRAGAGVRVRMTLPSGEDHPEPGQIDFVESGVNPETGTVRARALFPNNDRNLVPGQFVRLALSGLQLGMGVTAPHRAVASGDTGPRIYVVDDEGHLIARAVELGNDLGDEVVVVDGIETGDRMVVDGLRGLSEGDLVEVVDEVRDHAPETPQVLGVLPPANLDVGDEGEPDATERLRESVDEDAAAEEDDSGAAP